MRLRDPASGVARLFVPGGGIGAQESPAQAARRETLEETGYAVQVEAESERIARYPFVWAGVEFDCTTHFFRARLLDPEREPAPMSDDPINLGTVWLPLRELDAELGFDSAIHAAVRELVVG